MKKLSISFFLLTAVLFSAFSTELTTGLTYDSRNSSFPIGVDFSLKEAIKNDSELTVDLTYQNAGVYKASLLYNKFLGIFVLSGGLNYELSAQNILPSLHAGAGLILKDFSIIASGGTKLNPDNIFNPGTFNCGADIILDASDTIVDLSFLYSSQESASGKTTKAGGGLVATAYQEGTPGTVDVMINVLKIMDSSNNSGFSVDAGMGINILLPFMDIHLKTVADIIKPGVPFGSDLPFSVSLSTTFVL